MWWKALLLMLIGTTTIAADPPRARKGIEGTWQGVSSEINGKPMPPISVQKMRFVFDNGKYTYLYNGKIEEEGTYTIDPDKKPATIDWDLKGGKKLHGYYEVTGNSLKFCFADVGQPRPKGFVYEKGKSFHLFRVRRIK